MELSGKFEPEDKKGLLDEFVEKSQDIDHGKMLYWVTDFHFPSLAALAVEMFRLPGMLKLATKFERAAILADKNWIRKISEMEGACSPA